MSDFAFSCAVVGLMSWGLLWPGVAVSSSSPVPVAAELPAPVAMNRGAGEGMHLLVDVQTENGETLTCAVDTGSPNTVLPARLERTLGRRLGSRRFSTLDSHNKTEHLYAAPNLYLGKTRLVTGKQVGVSGNFGILGMDCLRNYCMQLDFEARTVRFLSSDQLKVAEFGKPFFLTKSRYATIKHQGFFQQKKQAEVLIDTGCPFDGYLNPRAFKRAVREQHARSLPLLKAGVVQGTAPGMALFSQCIWDRESYTNLIIGKRFDSIGLRFLARHLVTFDFPRGIMYLKRTGSNGLPKRVSVGLESANQVDGADKRQPSGPEMHSTSAAAVSRGSCSPSHPARLDDSPSVKLWLLQKKSAKTS